MPSLEAANKVLSSHPDPLPVGFPDRPRAFGAGENEMELTYFLTTLGLIPYITSRAFLPLFASALIARYGAQWRPLADLAGVQLLDAVPTWAVSDAVLTTLGVLALAEVACNKSPGLRELLSLPDTHVKGLAAFVFCLALAGPLDPALGTTLPVVQNSALGLSWTVLWALMIGSGTWFLARLRKGIYHFLMEVDADDDLGLQKLLSWLEDGFGFLGALFVVLLPAVALTVTGLTLLALYLVQKHLERQEEKRKVPCGDCGTPNPLCGVFCARCGKERSHIREVGFLGTIKEVPVTDPDLHRSQLQATKRCRRCGERLREKGLDQRCQACDTPPFDGSRDLEAYIGRLQGDLPRTLLLLLGMGAVPVVGLVAGVIYYRLTLISGLRHYVPGSSRFLARWAMRIAGALLVCLQPIPLAGALSLPALCLLNFLLYRRLLRRQGRVFALPEVVEA